ncbi:hypothetical protein Shyhy01_17840 [Streptomyces hygroscopicus subsp. hygroscopicus]|nr:hypothetical protein Shyhy01_17840 [Streptomyces hygroscopicus subsp. hygroscopicus]
MGLSALRDAAGERPLQRAVQAVPERVHHGLLPFSGGADPLHLALIFGIDEKTAIRYADSARALLEQAAGHSTGPSAKELGPERGDLKNDGHADSTGRA